MLHRRPPVVVRATDEFLVTLIDSVDNAESEPIQVIDRASELPPPDLCDDKDLWQGASDVAGKHRACVVMTFGLVNERVDAQATVETFLTEAEE